MSSTFGGNHRETRSGWLDYACRNFLKTCRKKVDLFKELYSKKSMKSLKKTITDNLCFCYSLLPGCWSPWSIYTSPRNQVGFCNRQHSSCCGQASSVMTCCLSSPQKRPLWLNQHMTKASINIDISILLLHFLWSSCEGVLIPIFNCIRYLFMDASFRQNWKYVGFTKWHDTINLNYQLQFYTLD